MTSSTFTSFAAAYRWLAESLRRAPTVEQDRWQGVVVKGNPAARCYEVRDVAVCVDLAGSEDLDRWRGDVKPNVPWADDHFAERVGGEPLNPGVQWAHWPWGSSADRFRGPDELFNHTYMERLWPRQARGVADRQGIDRRYGDLNDLVDLLARDPHTRQAFIPLFFPEDTGWGDGGRKMCSLGYQFTLRGGRLNLWYPLRSCDFAHHWRDDCYLAVRMLLWVLGKLRERDADRWASVVPGDYAMWMTSLHIFENDWRKL